MKKEDLEIGNDIVIIDQKNDERFIVTDIKDNGYVSALEYALDKDGKAKRQFAKKVSIPMDDIIGIQHTMKF